MPERASAIASSGPKWWLAVPALRLSDGRVLAALLQVLCQVAPRPDGFRRRELRPLVAGLLGRDLERYSTGAVI
jgi:hypothetical protein